MSSMFTFDPQIQVEFDTFILDRHHSGWFFRCSKHPNVSWSQLKLKPPGRTKPHLLMDLMVIFKPETARRPTPKKKRWTWNLSSGQIQSEQHISAHKLLRYLLVFIMGKERYIRLAFSRNKIQTTASKAWPCQMGYVHPDFTRGIQDDENHYLSHPGLQKSCLPRLLLAMVDFTIAAFVCWIGVRKCCRNPSFCPWMTKDSGFFYLANLGYSANMCFGWLA